VLQIVTKRNDKLRGQAFVVFREVAEATAAKNNLNGYPIFGKPMVDIDPTLENMLCSKTQQTRQLRRQMICIDDNYY
jgi:U2 small nuclear ribonucleoprotein B''